MGVIRTDQWLKESFDKPEELIKPLLTDFNEDDSHKLYAFLETFGMYSPNRRSKKIFDQLVEKDSWETVERLHKKYKKKWQGPDVPIYIFPIAAGGIFSDWHGGMKSGLSFSDKIFLFLPVLQDEKELEALFVHEYHHVCRINKQQKTINQFNLLDSIVLEGLAEYAVEMNCGKQYRSKWCTKFTRDEIEEYWNRYVKDHLDVKKNKRVHDQVLFGGKRYPRMLGYSVGYEIISIFREREVLTIKNSFILEAEKFLPKFKK
ncbi:DUF2268 domain-containing protein [Cytobacillus purgationiresistens]|uniref:Uncharacterized protein YjaZ n=1 Tax=Cytobacillus purgationiresistens TaxID=863449 RepID=A0ABU0AD76_9BACI|nr:DUF2268 domain-containing protein [Cytobacillus purgationiresistens]MDQ0268747.1 uncharacterized protein YjaZ [Cytobacillus purgationiresistens]